METIKEFNPELLPSSSFTVVLAKRRGGKSTLVADLIKKLYKKNKINLVYLFSGTDADFDMIDNKHRFNDISKLDEIVERYRAMNEFNKVADNKDKFKVKTMIILDDLLLKLKSKDFKIIEQLAVNGRHVAYSPLSLHICILAQNLTSIPRLVRNNTDIIFLNNISSMRELELIMDENMYVLDSSRQGKAKARTLYNQIVTHKDFCFLVINNYKQNVRQFSDYLNWYCADV